MFTNLVVNSEGYGSIWIDDRSSEAGIYPFNKTDDLSERVNFLDWLKPWLDQSAKALKSRKG